MTRTSPFLHVVQRIRAHLEWRGARRAFYSGMKKRNSHAELATIRPHYGNLHIGSNVNLANACLDTHGNIAIGDETFFGWEVKILTGTHPIFEKGLARQQQISSKDVLIGKGVWVASYAIILPGSVIGDNSVVSAGSIVSGKFPSEKLIAGNPAQIVGPIDFIRGKIIYE